MPQILVVTDDAVEEAGTTVVYRERILSSDLESEHYSGQLVERVGWAVRDASQIEHQDDLRRRSAERASGHRIAT